MPANTAPGRLNVDVTTDGEQVVIRVSDDGHGNSTRRCGADIRTVLHDASGARAAPGLGLPIARAVLANAGGTLEYTPPSDTGNESTGASFTIWFRR